MPRRLGEAWQHEPTSAASQPDRVPSKSLPPLSSMDRMANGEHLGQCPTCGGHQWWDNRARKAIGELSRSQPDYVCTDCRHGRWIDGRQRSGWAVPTGHRAPYVRVTVVAPVVEPANAVARRGSCAAMKRDGSPCRNGAMAGSSFCGPHSHGGAVERVTNRCQGTTKAGQPCRAGAVRGTHYCPQHEPRP